MSQKFDGFTIVNDLTVVRDIMIHSLSDYFSAKNRYTQSKLYLKYQKWIQQHTNPSAQNTYNLIKRNTTLVDNKKVLLTLTDGAIYYRFETNFHTYITTKMLNLSTTTPIKSNKPPSPPKTDNTKDFWEQPPLPSQIEVTATDVPEEDSLNTPKLQQEDEYSTQIHDIVQNMERNLDKEVESIKHEFMDPSPPTKVHIQQMELKIDELQQKLQNITVRHD